MNLESEMLYAPFSTTVLRIPFLLLLLRLFFSSSFFQCIILPWGIFWSPYLHESRAAARAALPVPSSVCSVLLCPNVRTAVDTHASTHGALPAELSRTRPSPLSAFSINCSLSVCGRTHMRVCVCVCVCVVCVRACVRVCVCVCV